MATIKLKFRSSTVKGNEGTLFFQIIHRRKIRQVSTEQHIRDDEWDTEGSSIFIPADANNHRVEYLTSIKETVEEQRKRLQAIISHLDNKGFSYDAQDVVMAFHNLDNVVGIVSFIRKLIDDMKRIGKDKWRGACWSH